MAILQPLIDIPAICYAHGIRHAVVSPGSRSAPLTLAFARHGGFQMQVCMDERSAAFIGLGIAQQTSSVVVLICTSGSAAYNFAPGVSEAFFQQIPLLILTADRPKEWMHQYDGQTIYQNEIYGKHVKRSFELPADYGHKDATWAINRIVNEAIGVTQTKPHGPVHINVPIREPFYPSQTEEFVQSEHIRIISRVISERTIPTEPWNDLLDELDAAKRILIVVGQHNPEPELSQVLAKIAEEWNVPVVGDCVSNLSGNPIFIRHHDLFLSSKEDVNLTPDLLITFGLSLVSKELKLFLRKNPPFKHWHVGEDSFLADPMQSMTQQIAVEPLYFFNSLFEKVDYQLFVENADLQNDSSYGAVWQQMERAATQHKVNFVNNLRSLNDTTSLDFIFEQLDNRYQLHLGNSMSIRYANALATRSDLGLFCNRGTSGIDGCVSTAIGAALVNNLPTLLIVGDVSFLYDRNGLLIRHLPENLKIVVINNAGGNIFRIIDGPAGLPELGDYFETRHSFTAKRTCEDSGMAYFELRDFAAMQLTVEEFLSSTTISLLEIFTDPEENRKAWKGLKSMSI
ncbi:2-succinyl-5-enolpyruvyl-6-hydroxy-3-cyclohexene-1-carboxylic-acid synthase [Dyadobacter crusticola]|uniref:2-succinyl-5-enolpyruvyl-6-hydroxy-3- cyclohexene-1-carboxylic-acid synthase n=1 Tax=Dyadobacter crusticola TaxID=292407 RepID=UPI0004E0EF11|nr:2-succinyl-5-enolpyruvyl-6-hydroxy-3-cyclohexene-1-carboxylic-acid synthase [Dyadobacter crusticola]